MDFGSPRVDLQVDQLTMLTTGYVEYSMRFTGDFPLGYVKCLDCHILQYIEWIGWIGLREHLHRKPIRFSQKNILWENPVPIFPETNPASQMLPGRLILRSRPPSTSTRPFCRSSKSSRRKFQGISWEPMILSDVFFKREIHYLGNPKREYVYIIIYIYIYIVILYI